MTWSSGAGHRPSHYAWLAGSMMKRRACAGKQMAKETSLPDRVHAHRRLKLQLAFFAWHSVCIVYHARRMFCRYFENYVFSSVVQYLRNFSLTPVTHRSRDRNWSVETRTCHCEIIHFDKKCWFLILDSASDFCLSLCVSFFSLSIPLYYII